ncbi:MAG: TlpA disulfide reductase family protein [Pseudohongiella sp.]|nr:TlpA disulfide reductase family protein [Pseudohongiella sp.]MDO9521783.1 TlpA disulfide reductase family protein [Pseudohongiella sp.]MDP2128395.1 TlpA disulfide reductase family protein [Pseudohongiella sp.]
MLKLLTSVIGGTLLISVLFTVPASAAEEGILAPDFTLPGVRDNEAAVTLSELRGDIVYVDFWASWCAPCLRSLPEVNSLYEQYKDQGFTVVAVTIDDPVEDALDFLLDLETPLAYHVVLDQTAEIMDQYAVTGMPTSFLIDREGVVRMVHKGFREGDTDKLEQALTALLAEQPVHQSGD